MECDQPQVTVDVDAVEEPIAGAVTARGQVTRPFTGWLQMISVLQEALESARTPKEAEEEG